MTILQHFPEKIFYPNQREALIEIENGIKLGKRFILLEMGTGGGKSVIMYTTSRMLGTGHIVVMQHVLQEQYVRTLHLPEQKGRGTSLCKYFQYQNQEVHCDAGKCITDKKFRCEFKPVVKISAIVNDFINSHYSSRVRPEVFKAFERFKLTTDATEQQLKDAFRKLVLQHHPDTGGDPEEFIKDKDNFEIASANLQSPSVVAQIRTDNNFACTSGRGELFWQSSIHCNYWQQKCEAISSPIVVHNYPYLIGEANFVGDFGNRTLLGCDEAHNLDKVISDFVKITVTQNDLDLVNITFLNHGKEIVDWIPFLKDMKTKIYKKLLDETGDLETLKEFGNISIFNWGDTEKITEFLSLRFGIDWIHHADVESTSDTIQFSASDKYILLKLTSDKTKVSLVSDDGKTIEYPVKNGKVYQFETNEDTIEKKEIIVSKLEECFNKLEKFFYGYTEHPENWTVMLNYDGNTIDKIELKPTYIGDYAESLLFRLGNTVLMMSATILDPVIFCQELGIPLDQVHYINVPSSFPPERAPIYPLNIGKINSRNFEEKIDVSIKALENVLDIHEHQRGIVHCTSRAIRSLILNNIGEKYRSRLLVPMASNKKVVLERMSKMDNAVLMSISDTEGLDLRDDLSRFQYFPVLPFSSLNDPRIKKKNDMDTVLETSAKERGEPFVSRYEIDMFRKLAQASGRSIRTPEDYAWTYVAPSSLGYYIQKFSKYFEFKGIYPSSFTSLKSRIKWDKEGYGRNTI
ncbi:MAG: helicase C-terminal domain-containing protein [Pedobacter sp.]|uniref:helicase C-terminal domain-containing protein n=1 Tax=Pedobacter sp. TaxID=1411316 RepID=UPI00356AE4E9